MKKIVKQSVVTLLCALSSVALYAQNNSERTMYIIKDSVVIFETYVSEIDSIIFYDPQFPLPIMNVDIYCEKGEGEEDEYIANEDHKIFGFLKGYFTSLNVQLKTKVYSLRCEDRSLCGENDDIPTAIWSSSNPDVATVSSSGLVTFKTVGFTEISVKVWNFIETIELEVKEFDVPHNSVGVKIGENTWATSNYGSKGNNTFGFQSNPEILGEEMIAMFDPETYTSIDPCPEGWRLPKSSDISELLDDAVNILEPKGVVFGVDENIIFLPKNSQSPYATNGGVNDFRIYDYEVEFSHSMSGVCRCVKVSNN